MWKLTSFSGSILFHLFSEGASKDRKIHLILIEKFDHKYEYLEWNIRNNIHNPKKKIPLFYNSIHFCSKNENSFSLGDYFLKQQVEVFFKKINFKFLFNTEEDHISWFPASGGLLLILYFDFFLHLHYLLTANFSAAFKRILCWWLVCKLSLEELKFST